MLQRFNKNDIAIVAHYLGSLIMIFGAIMLAPLLVSIICAEWTVSFHYVMGIGIAVAFGALLRLAKIDPQRMNRKHAIAITSFVWIIGAVLAAVPLYLSGHYLTFLDAVFEGVSGLTATGLSLAQDIDHMSMTDNTWRFTMQFVGGQGVIVVAISLGMFARTGNTLYNTEGREEAVMPNIMNTARFIWKFAIAAVVIGTIVITVVLLASGMQPVRGVFHALWLTIGAYDTGGFSPGSLSLISYHSWLLEIIAMLLMLFGALNFSLVAQVQKGNWREFVRDIEVRTLALWTTIMVVVFVAALAAGNFVPDIIALMRKGVFTIVSATTNTGFQVLSTGQITTLLSSGAFFLVAISMAVGGSSASTAGGIKALRVGIIFKGIGLSIRRVLQPRSAMVSTSYNHVGRHRLTSDLLSSAMIITALYVLSYLIGTLAGIAYGYEAIHATYESISAASNAGLSSGIVAPGMPIGLEVLYIIQMWLGRLEFITLLALFASVIASILPRRKPEKPTFGKRGLKWLREIKEGKEDKEDKGSSSDDNYSSADNDASSGYGRHADTGRSSSRGESETKSGSSGENEIKSDSSRESKTKSDSGGFIKTPLAVLLSLLLACSLLCAPLATASADTVVTSETSELVEEVTIEQLAASDDARDSALVSFEGEAVGDAINTNDPNYVWITFNEGQASISVYLPRDLQEKISYMGSYAHDGTKLRLIGEYHVACEEHDGTSDVHAQAAPQILDEGGPREHPLNLVPLYIGAGALVLAGILALIYHYLRKKRR